MIAPIAPHGRPVDSRRFGRASTIVDPAPFASMIPPHAPVAELVDAPDSKSGSARSAGSSPARGTIVKSIGWTARHFRIVSDDFLGHHRVITLCPSYSPAMPDATE